MRNDLDSLMQANNIDALWVTGAANHNPTMIYLTGIVHVSVGDLIKLRGKDPVLFHGPMERDEAAKTGYPTVSYSQYPLNDLLKEAGGDYTQAFALRYKKMFADLGLTSGRIALYGNVELGPNFALVMAIQKLLPEIEFTGFIQDPIFLGAMMTKDKQEMEHIRSVGKATTAVVGRVADYLTSQKAKDGILVDKNGNPVTIGKVKSLIDLWLAEFGTENPEGCIFAQGRDAGVPHSTGNNDAALRLGDPIIFDIYPCQAGGGYFHDFTRTWCLGYATDEVQKLYDQVLSVYRTVTSELRINTPYSHYQHRTCELFEAMGHPTLRSDPVTEEGYVHSLGHGVGLRIHEKPSSGLNSGPTDMIVPGVVIAVEPGLYYPSRGMGCRVENTLYAHADGTFETLVEYPVDLVLPLKS